MDEKKYTTGNLYIGVISRQTARQNWHYWGLLNKRYCVLIKETNDRYRCVLTDGIYAVSSSDTPNQDVINSKTVMPLTDFKPSLKDNQYISRSEIRNLEDTELKDLFQTIPDFEEFRENNEMYR